MFSQKHRNPPACVRPSFQRDNQKNVFLKKHKAIICPASDSDLTSLRILTNCF